MSAYGNDARPDEAEARFVGQVWRCADHYGGIIGDGSQMNGTGDWGLYFAAVEDGWLEHVKDQVIDGVRQVPFFRITDKGRAWIGQVRR
jgi:hypothetical protein